MPSSWKAEVLDRVQDKFFVDEEHDRTIRCLLTFHNTIDVRRVVRTIEKLVGEIPILNSTFQENSGTFTWNSRADNKTLLWAQWNSWPLFFQDYLGVSDPATTPQIKVILYDNVIAFKVNGMLMDIFALRSIVAFFCEIYNNIDNVLFKSKYASPNKRSSKELMRNLPLSAKLFARRFGGLSNAGFNALKINHVADRDSSSSWINTDGYYGSEVEKLYELATKYNTTISNIFLTAYNRAVAAILNQKNVPINIANQIDVRRDAKKSEYISYNNAYVMLPYSNKIKDNEIFSQTLKNISNISSLIRKKHLAAKSYAKNHKTYGITEYFQFASIGQIQKDKYNLTGNQIFEIFFATPARFLPYISITLASIDKTEIFLTACNYCTQSDLPNIKYLFEYIKYEIRNFINTEDKEFYKTWSERVERAKATGFKLPEQKPASSAVATSNTKTSTPAHKITSTVTPATSNTKTSTPAHKSAPTPVASSNVKTSTRVNQTKKNVQKHTPTSNSKWTSEQEQLAKKYQQYTGSILEPVDDNKVRYKIKGKNSYQSRTWADIKKFVDFKTKK